MQQLLKTIQASYDTLPQAQKAVAGYIIEHYQDIPFLSVTSMAREIGVSDTTIIKYCMQLGFTGFGDFKRTVSDYVQSHAKWSKQLERSLDELEAQDPYAKVYQRELENIKATISSPANRQSYEKLLTLLGEAENIYILGFRASSFPAQYLSYGLGQQGYRTFVITPGVGDHYQMALRMTKKDLLISFCYSQYGKESIRIIQHAVQNGVPHIAFTDSQLSPSAVSADGVFLCSVQSYSTTPSLTAVFSLINMVLTGCAQRHPAEATQNLKKLEDFITSSGVYYTAQAGEGK